MEILIADDHSVVRRGLRALLESHKDWRVCGEAANGIEAVEMAKKWRPDAVVMDITMSELNGVEATRQIRKISPETEVLILSMHDSEPLLQQGLQAGARGYILKDDADKNLLAAVEAISKRERYLSPKIMQAVDRGKIRLDTENEEFPGNRLSARQREIVQLLAEGKTNKEAATILNISAKTVETHRAHIMLKLGLRSVTELVHYAVRNHLVKQ